MDISEQERREGIASELADIIHRQQAMIQCNEMLGFDTGDSSEKMFHVMAQEDMKNLRMIEGVINSFGVRVEPKTAAMAMAEMLLDTISDDAVSPLEQLMLYTLLKQNQMLCSHILHKSAQLSPPDIKLALGPIDGIYATFTKQVAELLAFTEAFGAEWITGEKPKVGITGRMLDAVATVTGVVLSKTAKPTEDMNVMKVLKIEHRKVDALFKEIEEAKDFATARDLFVQLKADLTAHSIAEEDTVYASFKRFADARETMNHAKRQHKEFRALLDEISLEASNEDLFDGQLSVLKDLVKHHVEEEEGKTFDLIKAHSTEKEQIQLSQAFLEAKRLIQMKAGVEPMVASIANQRLPGMMNESLL